MKCVSWLGMRFWKRNACVVYIMKTEPEEKKKDIVKLEENTQSIIWKYLLRILCNSLTILGTTKKKICTENTKKITMITLIVCHFGHGLLFSVVQSSEFNTFFD